jgi:TonB family protein
VDSGLSGECLRTGNSMRCDDTERDYRVDPEVCRALGLRSIAAVPIRGRHGVVGILEVFSTRIYAFDPGHVELLEKLAKLAAGSSASESLPGPPEPKLSRWREAGDVGIAALLHARDSALSLALRGRQSLALGIALAVLVAGLAIARFYWRSPAAPLAAAAVSSTTPPAQQISPTTPPLASANFNWKANDASTPALKPSSTPAAAAIQRAASVAKESSTARSAASVKSVPSRLSTVGRNLNSGPVRADARQSTAVNSRAVSSPDASAARGPAAAPASPEPPALSPRTANEAMAASMIAAPASVPRFTTPVSAGIQDGAILHRVQPVYPVEALPLRLEGTVTIEAIITVSGSLSGLKVISGHPILAKAAMNAVRQWRYRPYQLNGKPVAMATRISVSFKPE